MTLSRSLSIRRLLSFISTNMIIDATMIAKNVIKTVNELDVIENNLGSPMIAPVIVRNEIPSVIPLSSVNGKHSVAKFKNPV